MGVVIMSKLIDELKEEHSMITDALNKVQKAGFSSKEGQRTLLLSKNRLLSHLKKEDEQLYPVLWESAKKDSELKRILDKFAKDMKEISKFVVEFFDKYSEGGSGIEFAKDYGKFHTVLSSRLRREEVMIFPKYKEIRP